MESILDNEVTTEETEIEATTQPADGENVEPEGPLIFIRNIQKTFKTN